MFTFEMNFGIPTGQIYIYFKIGEIEIYSINVHKNIFKDLHKLRLKFQTFENLFNNLLEEDNHDTIMLNDTIQLYKSDIVNHFNINDSRSNHLVSNEDTHTLLKLLWDNTANIGYSFRFFNCE
jgi:hypothetical protein